MIQRENLFSKHIMLFLLFETLFNYDTICNNYIIFLIYLYTEINGLDMRLYMN